MNAFQHSYWTSAETIARIVYCGDAMHPNHKNIQILAPVFHRCVSLTDFLAKVVEPYDEMLSFREHASIPGPTPAMLSEQVVASKNGAFLDDFERTKINQTMWRVSAPHSPGVAWWHLNHQTGRADMHALFGGTANIAGFLYPRLLGFGRGKANYIWMVRSALNQLIDDLNVRRKHSLRKTPLEPAKLAQRAAILNRGIVPVATQLFLAGTKVSISNVRSLIESLGHEVLGLDEMADWIEIRFKGRKKVWRFGLVALVENANAPKCVITQIPHYGNTVSAHLGAAREAQQKIAHDVITEKVRRVRNRRVITPQTAAQCH